MYSTNWIARLITTAKWQKKKYIYKNLYHYPHRCNWFGCCAPAALSLAGIATAVTGIGAFASVPIGGVAAIIGISSTLLTGFIKKIQYKLTKKNTVAELVSKAHNDNKVSDSEFNLVPRELEKYHELKAAIRAENAQPKPQPPPPAPDVEQIKMQLRKEI